MTFCLIMGRSLASVMVPLTAKVMVVAPPPLFAASMALRREPAPESFRFVTEIVAIKLTPNVISLKA
ncbi:hypothetical protein [Acidocella aminolytica]|uniref:hypothetical protein n=1 Tax=Acidocella aminolytica TaxID=33998 RepID=UPI00222F5C75|nr:hypothetical protein [Acidocella aminolytica]